METVRLPILLQNGPLKLSAFFHLPSRFGPHPAVLIVHGYGGNKIGYRRRYIHLAESLGKADIATLRLDLRGCGDSEGRFSSLTFDALVSDVLLALRFLEQYPAISKVGLLGSSLGGAIAVRSASTFPVSGLALWAAIADGSLWQSEWTGTDEELERHLRCGEDGAPTQLNRESFGLRSDLEVERLTVPLLNVHGALDTLVSPSHQEAYKKARREHTLDQFLLLPKSDHRFSHDEERAELIRVTTDWFQKTLL